MDPAVYAQIGSIGEPDQLAAKGRRDGSPRGPNGAARRVEQIQYLKADLLTAFHGRTWFEILKLAQITCYTDPVLEAKQNLTLVVEEELLLAARKAALEQRTSVNQLVRDYLTALVEQPGRRRIARARLNSAFGKGLIRIGAARWTRDDLYDR